HGPIPHHRRRIEGAGGNAGERRQKMAGPLRQTASTGPVGKPLRIPRPWRPSSIQLRSLVPRGRQIGWRRRRRRRHRKLVAMRLIRPVESSRLGFTLIELMVVIVLAGIMAAAIIPEMRGTYEDALLRAAGRELVDVFSIAGSRAASLNEAHRVRLERNSGRYWIERKSSDGESPSGFVRVHDVPGSEGKIDSRISIEFKRAGDEPEETLDAGAPTRSEQD